MKVMIAVLCFNEAKNLPFLVETLVAVKKQIKDAEVSFLVVNNGSTDETAKVIDSIITNTDFFESITIPVNLGYGYGVKKALDSISGDIIGFMWGDNQFDATILKPMIQTFIDQPNVQVVKTYRTKRYDGRLRLFVSRIYQLIFRLLYGIYTHDINSGPKLFRTDFLSALKPFHSNDWFIDAELMIKSTRNSTFNQIVEFPITFYPRKFGKSNVRFSTCFQFFWNLIKYKFVKL